MVDVLKVGAGCPSVVKVQVEIDTGYFPQNSGFEGFAAVCKMGCEPAILVYGQAEATIFC